ncbi:MAG: HEAT repeat domain-containing protein [Planctomycetota bacterium]|nr:HEAT repeat domain-containing protein [Planctomycetota bacterium]
MHASAAFLAAAMRAGRIGAAALAFGAALAVDDDAPPPGMDVLPWVRAAAAALSPPPSPLPGRPWSDDLAALTAPDPTRAAGAIARLVRIGSAVIPDLAILADDRDWQLRARIVRVLAGIGGRAVVPLLLRLADDREPRVRHTALLALARAEGPEVYQRLVTALASADPDERALAAEALGGYGDPRAIPELARRHDDPDAPARAAQLRALQRLVRRERAVPVVEELLRSGSGEVRRVVLEALAGHNDTRLSPALGALLDSRDALEVLLAARALASAGDARAVAPLIQLAASDRLPQLCDAAASTLQRLTGYRAGPGKAWELWWRDQRERYQRLAARDALIAELTALDRPLPDLSAFTTEELAPLIDIAIEQRPAPPWLPARVLAALRREGERWIEPLVTRIDAEADSERRLELLLLLDEIGGPAAKPAFVRQFTLVDEREAAAHERWRQQRVVPPDLRPERALIRLALERR